MYSTGPGLPHPLEPRPPLVSPKFTGVLLAATSQPPSRQQEEITFPQPLEARVLHVDANHPDPFYRYSSLAPKSANLAKAIMVSNAKIQQQQHIMLQQQQQQNNHSQQQPQQLHPSQQHKLLPGHSQHDQYQYSTQQQTTSYSQNNTYNTSNTNNNNNMDYSSSQLLATQQYQQQRFQQQQQQQQNPINNNATHTNNLNNNNTRMSMMIDDPTSRMTGTDFEQMPRRQQLQQIHQPQQQQQQQPHQQQYNPNNMISPNNNNPLINNTNHNLPPPSPYLATGTRHQDGVVKKQNVTTLDIGNTGFMTAYSVGDIDDDRNSQHQQHRANSMMQEFFSTSQQQQQQQLQQIKPHNDLLYNTNNNTHATTSNNTYNHQQQHYHSASGGNYLNTMTDRAESYQYLDQTVGTTKHDPHNNNNNNKYSPNHFSQHGTPHQPPTTPRAEDIFPKGPAFYLPGPPGKAILNVHPDVGHTPLDILEPTKMLNEHPGPHTTADTMYGPDGAVLPVIRFKFGPFDPHLAGVLCTEDKQRGRYQLLLLSRQAEMMERFGDMAVMTRQLAVLVNGKLTREERALFSIAHTRIVMPYRRAIEELNDALRDPRTRELTQNYIKYLCYELKTFCRTLINFILAVLLQPGLDLPDHQVFFLKMIADLYRYIAELNPLYDPDCLVLPSQRIQGYAPPLKSSLKDNNEIFEKSKKLTQNVRESYSFKDEPRNSRHFVAPAEPDMVIDVENVGQSSPTDDGDGQQQQLPQQRKTHIQRCFEDEPIPDPLENQTLGLISGFKTVEQLQDDKLQRFGAVYLCRHYYHAAAVVAQQFLSLTSPIRLSVILNYSVAAFHLFRDYTTACQMLKITFDKAISKIDELDDDDYRDATLLLQLMRDNLALWVTQQQSANTKDAPVTVFPPEFQLEVVTRTQFPNWHRHEPTQKVIPPKPVESQPLQAKEFPVELPLPTEIQQYDVYQQKVLDALEQHQADQEGHGQTNNNRMGV